MRASGRVRLMRRRAASYAAITWRIPSVAPYVNGKAFWPHEMRPYGSGGSPLPLPFRERDGVRGGNGQPGWLPPCVGMTPTDYKPQARSGPSVIPALTLSIVPPAPPLSFSPVVSGNPVSFSSVPSFM